MSTNNHDVKLKLEIQNIEAEIAERIENTINLRKKNAWFEILTSVGLIISGIAIAKYFL